MRRFQGMTHAADKHCGPAHSKPLLLQKQFFQGNPWNELHDDAWPNGGIGTSIQDADNVRMPKTGRVLNLAFEKLPSPRRVGNVLAHHFDDNVGGWVIGGPSGMNLAHAAATKHAERFVFAQK